MSEENKEALFINTTCHTRKHMQRVYQAAMPLWLVLMLVGLCAVVVILFASTLAIHLSSGRELPIPPSTLLALGYAVVLLAYVFFLRSFLGARRYEKVNRELHSNQTPQVTWHFFQDHMEAQSNFSDRIEPVDYENIIRVKETKNDFLLFRRLKLFYHLDKAGFEKGDAASFAAFLKEKLPGIKF